MATVTLTTTPRSILHVEARPTTIATGLAAVDAALQGGLRPGSLTLLVADPGDIQELFAMHFATTGDDVLYITTDRSGQALERDWSAFGRTAEAVVFHDARQPVPAGHDVPGRIVFDSFSRHAAAAGWAAAVTQLRDIQAQMIVSGQAALAIVFPGLHSRAQLDELAILADGIFQVDVDKAPTAQTSTVRITKMRGAVGAAKAFPVHVGPDGLFLQTVKRVL